MSNLEKRLAAAEATLRTRNAPRCAACRRRPNFIDYDDAGTVARCSCGEALDDATLVALRAPTKVYIDVAEVP